jgi:hypothetical protein
MIVELLHKVPLCARSFHHPNLFGSRNESADRNRAGPAGSYFMHAEERKRVRVVSTNDELDFCSDRRTSVTDFQVKGDAMSSIQNDK